MRQTAAIAVLDNARALAADAAAAAAELASGEAALAQDATRAEAALSRYDDDNLDRQPDVRVAARAVDAAAAAVAQAEAALDRAEVRAPRSWSSRSTPGPASARATRVS